MIDYPFYLVFGYLALSTAYLLLFSLTGRLASGKPPKRLLAARLRRTAMLYPVYKGDDVILASVRDTVKQQYPRDLFDIIVIADSLQDRTVQELRSQGCIVIPFEDAHRTKAKSLKSGLRFVQEQGYDLAVILDADNVVEEDFLVHLSEAFSAGVRVAQCQRTAKNTDTSFALLDAVSEGINNHIFRRGHRALGLSSGLIGSGMAFEVPFLLEVMDDVNVINGFDKDLEFRIFRRGVKIEYLEHINVFDEKVSRREVFQHQRTRWLASHWNFMRDNLRLSSFAGTSWDFRDKALQMMMPPRVLLLGAVAAFTAIRTFVPVGPSFSLWMACTVALIAALAMAVPARFWNIRLLRASMVVPHAIGSMLVALMNIKKAQQHFLHTPHTVVSGTSKG